MDMWQWCEEFNDQEGIDEIKRYMTLLPAAGGWGRNLAAMIETGIIVPSGLVGRGNRNVQEEVRKSQKRKEEEERSRPN